MSIKLTFEELAIIHSALNKYAIQKWEDGNSKKAKQIYNLHNKIGRATISNYKLIKTK